MGIHGGDSCKPEVRPGTREESASPAWLAAPVTGYQLPARRWPKNQPAENSNGQRSPPKTTITTRLRTDLGRQWTPVLTATKIKERHYNNVLSFPTLFQQEHRERRRQLETLKWRQSTACNHPHHGHNNPTSGTGRTPKERRTRSRQQGNP